MNSHKTIYIFNYSIFCDSLDNIKLENKNKYIINTINPHSYVVAKKDNIFKKALEEADILIPDGIGIVHAAKYFKNTEINRITGYDLLLFILKYLDKEKSKCFFWGSTNVDLPPESCTSF